eukprot:TRINITY_DN30179_c0_g1_i1.p1 TRINITY_DN30179_c0_g1~~TRINITY_DN30179_c0_g1_i1.p1  ORF type:complete len:864 (+),score=215.02 TRINITY_DN30179_c0_g1_i1:37-2628(+)
MTDRQRVFIENAAYMSKVDLPNVIDTILRRVLSSRPSCKMDVWKEVSETSKEEASSTASSPSHHTMDSILNAVKAGTYSEEEFMDFCEAAPPQQRRELGKAMFTRLTKHSESPRNATSDVATLFGPEGEPIDALYAQLAQEMRTLFKVDKTFIYICDTDNNMLFDPLKPENRLSGRGVVGTAASTQKPVHGSVSEADSIIFGKGMCLSASPIFNRDEVIAVSVVARSTPLVDFECEALDAFCVRSAPFLVCRRMKEGLDSTSNQVSVLLDVARRLASELEVNSLIRTIMAVSRDLLEADRSTLFLVDKEHDELWSSVADGTDEIRIPLNSGIAGTVASTGEALNISNTYADRRFNKDIDQQTGYKTNSMLTMPMKDRQGDIIGVTQMINKKDGSPFKVHDQKLLAALSAQAAVAIENSLLFKKTEESKNLFQSVLSSIKALILTLDKDGKLININHDPVKWGIDLTEEMMRSAPYTEWFQSKLGCSEPDMSRRASNIKSLAGDSYVNGLLRESITSCFQAGRDGHVSDFVYAMENDEKLEINYTTMALRNFEGEQNGVVVLLEDISHEKKMMATLGKYLSPELAAAALEGGGTQLGGQQLPVSVLFVDIRNFTGLSEALDAPAVVETLNHYFQLMGSAVLEYGGIVDKYIGDAVMAVYGVPFSSSDDALAVCISALLMCSRLKKWNEDRAKQGLKPINMGIGVNTGEVVAGNIGFEKRMEYTVIGDGVNLASRVEGATKEYRVRILITEFTYEATKGKVVVREIDWIKVVGKKKPVKIYELQGTNGGDFPISSEQEDINNEFARGLALYRSRKWKEALDVFEGPVCANDGPSISFSERCKSLMADPSISPKENWDGVWAMTKK